MMTCIANLEKLVDDYEKRFELLDDTIKNSIYSTSIEDEEGKKSYLEDYKQDFDFEYDEYNKILVDLETAKQVIARKKDDLKLDNGQTLSGAYVSVELLKRKAKLLEDLLKNKSKKRLIDDSKSRFYEAKELNFNSRDIQYEYFCTKRNIQRYEAEISKLNTTSFEVNYYFTFDTFNN